MSQVANKDREKKRKRERKREPFGKRPFNAYIAYA